MSRSRAAAESPRQGVSNCIVFFRFLIADSTVFQAEVFVRPIPVVLEYSPRNVISPASTLFLPVLSVYVVHILSKTTVIHGKYVSCVRWKKCAPHVVPLVGVQLT